MKTIKVGLNHISFIDDVDYEEVKKLNWILHHTGGIKYARSVPNKKYPKTILMHRWILKTKKGLEVDHINHNGLDNSRMNLRECEHADNMVNQKKPKNNTSGYKGIIKCRKGFRIYLTRGKTLFQKAGYKTIEDAVVAYKIEAEKIHGEFANKKYLSEI